MKYSDLVILDLIIDTYIKSTIDSYIAAGKGTKKLFSLPLRESFNRRRISLEFIDEVMDYLLNLKIRADYRNATRSITVEIDLETTVVNKEQIKYYENLIKLG